MAIFNGTDLILKVLNQASGGTEEKLMHSQNVSISMNVDTIDISNKDSSGFRDLLGGQKSFSLSADGLMDFNSAGTDTEVDELFDQMFGRTAVTFTFGLASTTTGDYTYSGSGFITSLEVSGGTEDAPTYSVSIEGTGALTQNDIA
jgi:TP901-1 family phage major tail protein